MQLVFINNTIPFKNGNVQAFKYGIWKYAEKMRYIAHVNQSGIIRNKGQSKGYN